MAGKYKKLKEFDIEKYKNSPVAVYGAGKDGEQIGRLLQNGGLNDFVYCDTHVRGSLLGKEICGPESIQKDWNIIIGSFQHTVEIYKSLKRMGVEDHRIFTARDLCRASHPFNREHSLSLMEEHFRYDYSVLGLNAYLNDGYLIRHIDLTITEICTLKCRACASLMPMYDRPHNCSEETVMEELDALLESNCYIEELCLIGGEPLVNQDLMRKILIRYKDSIQIGIFTIITNGTLLPAKETLEAMRNTGRFYAVFSNYGKLSRMQEEAVALLDCYKVEAALESREDIHRDSSRWWIDYGKVQHYDFSKEKHQNMFLQCQDKVHCATLLDGKLFLFTRIAHGVNTGLIPKDLPGNYVDLLGEPYVSMRKSEKREAVLAFLRVEEYPPACEYCNKDAGILVERAEQV